MPHESGHGAYGAVAAGQGARGANASAPGSSEIHFLLVDRSVST